MITLPEIYVIYVYLHLINNLIPVKDFYDLERKKKFRKFYQSGYFFINLGTFLSIWVLFYVY